MKESKTTESSHTYNYKSSFVRELRPTVYVNVFFNTIHWVGTAHKLTKGTSVEIPDYLKLSLGFGNAIDHFLFL